MKVLLIGASGYVGSRIAQACWDQGWAVIGCDRVQNDRSEQFHQFLLGSYNNIPDAFIQESDIVLWFAGHSTVRISEADPQGCVVNNVLNLAALSQRLLAFNKPMIYASSASVLSSSTGDYSSIAKEVSSNVYDASKLAFDIIAPFLGNRFVALRMATVSGWSPVMRWDLVFNAMNKTAATEGVVRVANASNFRSILFIEDLCDHVLALGRKLVETKEPAPGRQSLASWSGTIGGLGAEIAAFWRVPVELGPDTASYSFVLDERELHQRTSQSGGHRMSIQERCERFKHQMDWQ